MNGKGALSGVLGVIAVLLWAYVAWMGVTINNVGIDHPFFVKAIARIAVLSPIAIALTGYAIHFWVVARKNF